MTQEGKEKLCHLDSQGEAQMVDVSEKMPTKRTAIALGQVRMLKTTFEAIEQGNAPKGDVLGTARLAGIMAAKQTSSLIPLCHPLPLQKINVQIIPKAELPGYEIRAEAVAALTLYDMAKALEKSILIENIRLLSKTGGKSDYHQDSLLR